MKLRRTFVGFCSFLALYYTIHIVYVSVSVSGARGHNNARAARVVEEKTGLGLVDAQGRLVFTENRSTSSSGRPNYTQLCSIGTIVLAL